jgi:anaphase-promoting complex subunit 5
MQSKDRTFYQYALLNLALLQSDFGSFSEAVSAMTETIATARENKDLACLNYSLSWFYQLGKSHPEELEQVKRTGVLGTDKEALAFLKAKAKETGMWGLLGTSLLSEARQQQIVGDSISLALENITKASHLLLIKDIKGSIGSQMNAESTLFARLGQRNLAWLYNELFLECYSENSFSADVIDFTCKKAFMEASKGHYGEASSMLENIGPESMKVLHNQQYWVTCNLLLKLKRSLNKSDFVAAENFLQQLQANIPKGREMQSAIEFYSIELEMRKGHFAKAMEMLEKIQEASKAREEDMLETVKQMVLKAQIFDRAGFPQKGFSIAIRAAALAHRAKYCAVLWEAVGILCKILTSLDEFVAAIQLLKAIMPQALETEDCELVARLFSYLADAYMGLAGQAKVASRRKEQMNKVLECLERAFDEYSTIEHVEGQCEMLAKKATIMRLNGDLVLANDYAAMYLDIQKKAEEETIDAFQRSKV